MCNGDADGEIFRVIAGERFKGSVTRLRHVSSNEMEQITNSSSLIYPHAKTSGQICQSCRAIHEKDSFIFEQISIGLSLFALLCCMVYVWHCPDIILGFIQNIVQKYIPINGITEIIIVPFALVFFIFHFIFCLTGLAGLIIFPLMAIYWLARPILRVMGMATAETAFSEVLANTLEIETTDGNAEAILGQQIKEAADKNGPSSESGSEFTEEVVYRLVNEEEYENFNPDKPGKDWEWIELTEHLQKGEKGTDRFYRLSYITAMIPGMLFGVAVICALAYYAHNHGEHGATVFEYVDWIFGTKYSVKV